MKSTPAKFTVAQLAKTLGKPAKEVLFLLQGIGVDVKGVESTLDPSMAQAILTGKTQAPKSLIVRQISTTHTKEAPAVIAKPKPERAALKRIKLVEKPPESTEGQAEAADAPQAAEAPASVAASAEPVAVTEAPRSAAPAVEALAVPAPPLKGAEPAPLPVETRPKPPKADMVAKVVSPAEEPTRETPREPARDAAKETARDTAGEPPSEKSAVAVTVTTEEAPSLPVPAPTSSSPAIPVDAPPMVAAAAVPASTPAPAASFVPAPPHVPAMAASAQHPASRIPRRPAAPSAASASPQTSGVSRTSASLRGTPPAARRGEAPHTQAAPGQPPLPGALGRLQRRVVEPPASVRPLSPPSSFSMPPTETSSGASAGPRSPGVTTMRTSPPPPLPQQAAQAPIRGAGGLGRAVIAPPSAATTRSVRPPAPVAPPPSRPGALRPGMPPSRPGTFRPSGPGGRDMGPRPGFGRPAPPSAPPGPPLPIEKRRKDGVKPTTATKKEDAKKAAAKKPRTKEVSALEENVRDYLGNFQPDTYEDVTAAPVELDEDGNPIVKPLSKSAQRRAAKKTIETDSGTVVEVKKDAPSGPVFLSEGVTVKELSEKIGILAKDLMKAFLARGIFATINQPVDPNVAVEVSREFGVESAVVSFEEEVELSRQQALADSTTDITGLPVDGKRVPRAPVVTVMGHVDHGKTSLLDAIRKANVAEGEAGGITQHIGAYRVEVNNRKIVFLDTPGHEAFTMMRARGARATDIVVLVVAADDGVMPQTQEAIDHARAAKVPMVVAINKIDKPEANPTRVKQELAEKGVLVEAFGGEVVACEISAKKRVGIEQLLEMILLQADLLELKAVADVPARGVVLEARREAGKGTLATILVQQGTLRVGDVFFAGAAVGRVRAMLDDHGTRISEAGPATPVEVMGFDDLPNSGDTLQVVDDEQKARQVASFRSLKEREEALAKSSRTDLASLFSRMEKGEAKDLALIVKADVHGSEEVLVQTLGKLSTPKVKVSVLHSGVGAISVNDVLLASASEAIIIGFNVRPEKKAQELADKEGVDIRLYSVIYTLTDEIKKAMTGLLDTVKKEVARGRAEVRDTFKVPKIGTVAGCMVTEGVIPRTASVRLVRDNRVIYEGKVGSLRRFKDDASEVKTGFECGIGIAGYQDVKVGDVIEAFAMEDVAQSLT